MKKILLALLLFSFSISYGQYVNFLRADMILSYYTNTSGDLFGSTVLNAGDINNDGYDDLLVGSPGYEYGSGRVYIYLGGSEFNNVADFVLSGSGEAGALFGCALASGDVNGDGLSDVLIGAKKGGINGKVYIYLGNENFSTIPNCILKGENENDFFGESVAVVEDINKDGFNDFAIGAPNVNNNDGKIYIYLGKSILSADADVVLNGTAESGSSLGKYIVPAGDINLDGYVDILALVTKMGMYTEGDVYFGGETIDDSVDYTFHGSDSNDFGLSLSCLGDFNGDEYNDIVSGNPNFNLGNGQVKIFNGLSPMDGVPDVVLSEVSTKAFGTSLASDLDVNNDGYDDLVIGVTGIPIGGTMPSWAACYLYLGNQQFSVLKYAQCYGQYSGEYYFGCSVTGVDLNNDDFDEMIVGEKNPSGNGKVYIYGLINRIVGVEDEANMPVEFSLSQNYPNPFNPTTTINYSVKSEGFVSLKVYDILGKEVANLVNENKINGNYSVNFDASSLSSGTYIYQLKANGLVLSKKMSLIK